MAVSSRITIFHTNDFHNHLSAPQAALIKCRKHEGGPGTLLLDAGDAISAGNVGVRLGGEPILELMSDVGYDAMTLGNREFHVADSILRHKIAKATFPVLCANIRYTKESSDPLPLLPYYRRIMDDGTRVTVIGVTVPMVTPRMTARFLSAFLFDDAVATVKRLAAKLRQECDLLIALTHIGYQEDRRLAEACPELDLIVGGHSHVVLETAEFVDSVPIVQAGWFGHCLGRVDLDVTDHHATVIHSSLEDIRQAKAPAKC